MITVAIIGGSQPEMKEFVLKSRELVEEPLTFHVFDTQENIGDESLWHYHAADSEEAMANDAVKFVHDGHANILVKGIVATRTVLKAVLNKEHSLKQQDVLSHVAMIHLPKLDRPVLLTDAAMNITPDKDQLIQIIHNAIGAGHKVGMAKPKVALLSAAETLNPKMPSSVLANELTEAFKDQEDAIVAGPLSFDLAMSKEAVEHKRFEGPIAGDADILVVPSIDVGNVLYKSLILFADATMGGIIIGTSAPIVLTSRADAIESKVVALKLAISQLNK